MRIQSQHVVYAFMSQMIQARASLFQALCSAALQGWMGCSADNEQPTRPRTPAAVGGGAGTSSPIVPASGAQVGVSQSMPSSDGSPVLTPTVTTMTNTQSPEMCATTSAMAPAPADPRVDIVWVVDASGSMLD